MTLPLAALLQGAVAAGGGGGAEGPSYAIDLDGTNDYLSRSSDLTGNADGKTFTFSAWVYGNNQSGKIICNEGAYFLVGLSSNSIDLRAYNSSATLICSFNLTITLPNDTWSNIIISVDLANSANRYCYLNDVQQSPTWSTYTNNNIDFTRVGWGVGANDTGTNKHKGRLAHVFLDYTYRDLSNVTNRRLFITSDRKPAQGQAALNPILYLPMDDPSTAHINQGTGGNFTLNGVIARSGRGPNQYNVAYSDFDGANDYVNITGPLLGGGSKTLTFSCAFNTDTTGDQYLFGFWTSVSVIAQIFGVYIGSGGTIGVYALNSSGTTILDAYSTAGTVVVGRNYTLSIAIDLTNSAHRQVSLNGNPLSLTWATYTNDYIFFNQASNSPITSAGRCRSFYFNGRLGDVWFDTSYIDLSVPANLAKFVTGTGIDAKPVNLGVNGEKPLGTTPLIYLPMYGNNAGKNYGTGGDFTVVSGPYPGARGPNEFWGNWADFGTNAGYLSRGATPLAMSASSSFSWSFWMQPNALAVNSRPISIYGSTSSTFTCYVDTTNKINILAKDSSGTLLVNAISTSAIPSWATTSAFCIQIVLDTTNSSNRYVYVNGVVVAMTWTTYVSGSIEFNGAYPIIGAYWNGSVYTNQLQAKLSEFYFTTDYIDFSQEANRLKFRDAFGNSVDLTPQIQAGTIPNPAIYMRFDPADQGRNDGTGGNFTKAGTILDGGQL